ncbi:SDR family NAD(P)-dependent oxidoreductase [Sporomusa sp.]|jgi:gluconate 5-dehydrogenase|uniref:SDR family NAD(P)-dependent oxidoreductase n=1 Tax=Sporomusa sp. TaxID=2078658 RepID=UPI002C06B7A8|nr:SDR family NAD(P)-dependent oxidoreductase [Sporomusa sp.]HWR08677.1 SDR family NAD(P)-dependent oxidoreductase [Sporomusa sp.]
MSQNAFSLAGRTAVITGGLTGLGLAMTECMIAAGAKVVAVSSNSGEKFQEKFEEFGEKLAYYQFDVTDTDHAQELADKIIKEQGPVHFLCNNAGNHCKKPIEDMSVEDFTSVLNVHLVGAFALTKAFVPYMKQQRQGSIIFIASMTSFIGQPYVTGYATAKAGYLGMVHTLASELGNDGIRVNAIAPGWIDTFMFRQATDKDPQRKAKIFGRIPMNKVGDPKDIGWAAVYLCSDAAAYVSGICLPVDGGALIGF